MENSSNESSDTIKNKIREMGSESHTVNFSQKYPTLGPMYSTTGEEC